MAHGWLAKIVLVLAWVSFPLGAAAQYARLDATARQPDGKILYAGKLSSSPSLTLGRLNADGTRDASFAGGGETSYSDPGNKILGAEMSEPKEVVTAGDKKFAIVPMVVRVQVPTGALRSKSFLIAVSEDRGKTWTFVDSAGLVSEPGKEREKLAQILPDFPSRLRLPPREEPVWEPK